MSHITQIIISDISSAIKWANFFDSVDSIFDSAPLHVKADLFSVKASPGFCCVPDWQDFNGNQYDSKGLQPESNRQYWLVSDTMISAMNKKDPPPIGATTEYFSPVLHYPDRVQYAIDNMLTEDQSIDDLTDDQLAILAALGNDYYVQMPSDLWESFSQDTKDFLFTELGTPTQIIES